MFSERVIMYHSYFVLRLVAMILSFNMVLYRTVMSELCFTEGCIWALTAAGISDQQYINVVIIPKVYLVPEAKPRDTNIPRVLLLLVNDSPNLLVPKEKPRNTNNISYNYFYSANMPNHLLIAIR